MPSGTSARSGEGPPTTHSSHTHTYISSKPQPGKPTATRHTRTNIHGRHIHTTPTPPPRTHNAHTNTRRTTNTHNTGNPPPHPAETATTAAGRPQPGVAGNCTQDPQPGMERGHPPLTPADPPARSGGGPHPGPSARSGEGTPTQDPQPEARDHAPQTSGPQPAVAKAHPPTSTRGPQPGVAGSHTQDPQPGVARDQPPPPAASLSQEWRGHAHKQLGQRKGSEPASRTPTPPPHPAPPHTHHSPGRPGQGTRGAAPKATRQRERGGGHAKGAAGEHTTTS